MGLGPLLARQVLILTTRGRATGRRRKTCLWHMRQGDTLYCLSGWGSSSDWLKNLKANPWALIQIGKDRWETRGEVLQDPLKLKEIRRTFLAKYGLLGRLYYRSGTHIAVAFPLGNAERSASAGHLPP